MSLQPRIDIDSFNDAAIVIMRHNPAAQRRFINKKELIHYMKDCVANSIPDTQVIGTFGFSLVFLRHSDDCEVRAFIEPWFAVKIGDKK